MKAPVPTNTLNFSDLGERLLFAIPKKGRLHEQCLQLLSGADIQFHRLSRVDIALSSNLPIALVFLPAADIAKFVGEGNVDLGITGQDMIAEAGTAHLVTEMCELGFGKCKLSVQVPIKSGITEAKQLVGKRLATSFEGLSKQYFENLEKNMDSETKTTHIVSVSGSVEASCALGLADGIVDLVESGETMRAAGLHSIADILTSQAVLIANRRQLKPELVKKIAARIRGVVAAKRYVLCSYNVPLSKLREAVQITPSRHAPTISLLEDSAWRAVSAMILKGEAADIMDKLTSVGAQDILIFTMANCRV